MKRPEGFDPGRRAPEPPPRGNKPSKPAKQPAASAPRARKGAPSTSEPDATTDPITLPTLPKKQPTVAASRPTPPPPTIRQSVDAKPVASARTEARAAAHSARQARAELKRAGRERRRFERGEVRRFTRRSRNRKTTLIVALGLVAVLCATLAVAVYSPILALRTIEIDGASQLDAAELTDAVDGQLGTPLALVDFDRITRELGAYPLIRSYVTETVPPSTLIIHVVEREAVGVLRSDKTWQLVDPAGVILSTTTKRPSKMPHIRVRNNDTDSAAFDEAAKVLLALPSKLRAQVDTISASTDYSVEFTLKGDAGQSVVWGNAEQSEYKARILAILIRKTDSDADVVFNVASPDSAFINAK